MGMRDGLGICLDADFIQIANWKHNTLHGKARTFTADGAMFDENYLDGALDGKKTLTHATG